MSNSEGQFQSARRPRPAVAAMAAIAALGLVLAACGGGGGGNGNGDGSGFTLRVSFANETADVATLQLDDGEPVTVESCKGGVFSFEMPATDWILTVNGETAIDSLEYQPNELDNDVAARMWLYEDGRLELESFLPGSNISAPATISICT
ncbi:MAG TPA: hypothetical protein VF071_02425 [Candidatus Limnocylindria bacterium]